MKARQEKHPGLNAFKIRSYLQKFSKNLKQAPKSGDCLPALFCHTQKKTIRDAIFFKKSENNDLKNMDYYKTRKIFPINQLFTAIVIPSFALRQR
ncbi:hypothetical protein A0U91_07680 [Acetobacter persici]|uniref:Uncharacterized protein n=1 Tax=Acetobacter persici TaxID=1076596 RepID=A0A1U9LED0_9PROT|nr:hypothetical protein A0U91_07680 [Acetobacter persici]